MSTEKKHTLIRITCPVMLQLASAMCRVHGSTILTAIILLFNALYTWSKVWENIHTMIGNLSTRISPAEIICIYEKIIYVYVYVCQNE